MYNPNLYRVPESLFPSYNPLKQEKPGEATMAQSYSFATNRPDKPKALFLINNYQAIGFYRGWLPAREASRRGRMATKVASDQPRPGFKTLLKGNNYLTLSIPCRKEAFEPVRHRKKDTLVVVDVDDYLPALPLYNPSYAYWEEHLPYLLQYLKMAHVVTVTNLTLKKLYSEHIDAAKIQIVPNFVDLLNPTYRENLAKPAHTWIGFMGGYSHHRDIKLLEKPLQQVLSRHKEARFVLYGPLELRHQLDLTDDEVVWLAQLPQDAFPSRMRSFRVGLAPLEDTVFNAGKSALKILEYVAAGVLPIASAVGPYLELNEGLTAWARTRGWKGGGVLPLVTEAKDWEAHLERSLWGSEEDQLDYQERFNYLTAYVEQFCVSENLSMIGDLYASCYGSVFGSYPVLSEYVTG